MNPSGGIDQNSLWASAKAEGANRRGTQRQVGLMRKSPLLKAISTVTFFLLLPFGSIDNDSSYRFIVA